MVKIIAVIGSNKSGKTYTIEYITSKLTQKGYKIGSAKHVHRPNFTIDVEGKDTYRHANAGSDRIICLSEDEVAIIRKENGRLYTLEKLLEHFKDENFDLVILEGFRWLVADRNDIMKILTIKDKEDVKNLLKVTRPPILMIVGIKGGSVNREGNGKIPIINLARDGKQVLDMILRYIRSH